MLRTFGAFLSLFWLVGLTVHLDGMVHLLGLAALVLFAIDVTTENRHVAKPREKYVL